MPSPGSRVVVPLGSRSVTGIVISAMDSPPEGRAGLKPLRKVLDHDPLLPPDIVRLAQWTAEYYAAGVGETVLGLLPPKARGDRADAHKTFRVAALTAAGRDASDTR